MERIYAKKKIAVVVVLAITLVLWSYSMEADEEGFLYPLINQDLCRDCNECLRYVPSLRRGFKRKSKPDFYVAKHKDKDV